MLEDDMLLPPPARAALILIRREREKDIELAQKLGELQPFIAVFPQECMGQLAFFAPA
jgi:hypothetical protein